jgi:hypothetical protein
VNIPAIWDVMLFIVEAVSDTVKAVLGTEMLGIKSSNNIVSHTI